MRPEIFRLPLVNWPIQGYGLMIVIGFLLCTWLAAREARNRGLQVDVYNFGVVMLLSGLLGARLFYYWQFYSSEYSQAPWYEFFAIWKGGLVFYGGAIGGISGSLFYIWKQQINATELFDAISPFIPIGMGFGRLGCFMYGCCFGTVCSEDFPLALSFPASSPACLHQIKTGQLHEAAAQSLPVYPVQLMEAAVDFFLFGILWWYARGPSPRGGVLPLLFILYSIGRFCLEFWRADNDLFFWNMTISQVIAVGLFVASGGLLAVLWHRGLREPKLQAKSSLGS